MITPITVPRRVAYRPQCGSSIEPQRECARLCLRHHVEDRTDTDHCQKASLLHSIVGGRIVADRRAFKAPIVSLGFDHCDVGQLMDGSSCQGSPGSEQDLIALQIRDVDSLHLHPVSAAA